MGSQKKLSKAGEDAKIGSLTKGSINAAKTATSATVKVSGYVANRVGKLTKSMASYLASKAEKPISGVVATKGDKKQGKGMESKICSRMKFSAIFCRWILLRLTICWSR